MAGKNLAWGDWFSPIKCFAPDAVQIRRTFSEATLPTQIFLKEIAYILTCYQAFLKAQLFFIIFKAMEDNKVKTQILFACKFYLFPYLQLFIDKYKCIITK